MFIVEGKGQPEIARIFGLSQSRVSAIVHDKMPLYSYCRWCNIRMKRRVHVCPSCKERNRIERHEASEKRRILEEKKREDRRTKGIFTCYKCKKESQGFRQRVCNTCRAQPNYEFKQHCQLCNRITFSLWSICLICLPERDSLDRNRFGGREWVRELVRIRDKYTCQECGLVRTRKEVDDFNAKVKTKMKGKIKSLDVHHTNGRCGENSRGYDSVEELPNLVTVCHKCHYNRHDHSIKTRNPS